MGGEELSVRMCDYLGSTEVLSAVQTPETMQALMNLDADWSGFIESTLRRVREVNGLGGPRMHVVWGGVLEKKGVMPRYPDDWRDILDAERLLEQWQRRMDRCGKIQVRVLCFSFFSHRWERASRDVESAHPDTATHKKARALGEYGRRGTCPLFSRHTFDCYFWIDFAGVNQFDLREKVLGVTVLPAYVAACTEIIMYNSSTVEYEPRAWTRIERLLGYTFAASPLFVYLDDAYPNKQLDHDDLVARQPDSFVKVDVGKIALRIRHPADETSTLTDASDLPAILDLCSIAQGAQPLNPQRLMAETPDIVFNETLIMLDTEHYDMDARETAANQSQCRY